MRGKESDVECLNLTVWSVCRIKTNFSFYFCQEKQTSGCYDNVLGAVNVNFSSHFDVATHNSETDSQTEKVNRCDVWRLRIIFSLAQSIEIISFYCQSISIQSNPSSPLSPLLRSEVDLFHLRGLRNDLGIAVAPSSSLTCEKLLPETTKGKPWLTIGCGKYEIKYRMKR